MILMRHFHKYLVVISLFSYILSSTVHGFEQEKITCFHADVSGNIVAVTNDIGIPVARYVYSPYGTILAHTGSITNPFRFSGTFGITEDFPGLYFMRARYYSTDACRFLSIDPVKHIGPTWRYTPYAYGTGNPLRYADPRGEFIIEALAVVLVSVVALFVVEQTIGRPANTVLEQARDYSEYLLTEDSEKYYEETIERSVCKVGTIGDFVGAGSLCDISIDVIQGDKSFWKGTKEFASGYVPGGQLVKGTNLVWEIGSNLKSVKKKYQIDGSYYATYDKLKSNNIDSKDNNSTSVDAIIYGDKVNIENKDKPTEIEGNTGSQVMTLTQSESEKANKRSGNIWQWIGSGIGKIFKYLI